IERFVARLIIEINAPRQQLIDPQALRAKQHFRLFRSENNRASLLGTRPQMRGFPPGDEQLALRFSQPLIEFRDAILVSAQLRLERGGVPREGTTTSETADQQSGSAEMPHRNVTGKTEGTERREFRRNPAPKERPVRPP